MYYTITNSRLKLDMSNKGSIKKPSFQKLSIARNYDKVRGMTKKNKKKNQLTYAKKNQYIWIMIFLALNISMYQ